ncbi:STM4015 family protein [Chitinivorax sp. B]|uniref:STM4015 family protein n=1 Tax=Chitinivorax sp. B TaxID=2502235 RepID=UPI0010F47F0E|nr:STM4015 family protein [Chitinivorax sp. B]
MTIGDHQTIFHGKKVADFRPDEPLLLDTTVYRIAVEYDDETSVEDLLNQFLDLADKSKLDALIIGIWADAYESSPQPVLDLLVERSAELSALRALFVGDITYEECEISWIIQGRYKPLLDAFPQLEVLRIRGSSSLEIEPFEHANLRQLTIECGGLPSDIVNNLAKSRLPKLDHLELWLGTDDYGFDGGIKPYEQLLTTLDASRLRYLGLKDAEIADEVAIYVATQPWLAKLETLDLSMGTLSDIGAEALFNSEYVRSLKRLDVSHHYMSDAWMEKLTELPIEVIADEQQEAEEDDWRYVAVGE